MAISEDRSELERKIKELSVFNEVGKALTSTLDLSEVLRTVMEKISAFFKPDTWSLILVDEESGDLYFEIAIGEGAETLKEIRLRPGEGIVGWVIEHGEPVIVPKVAEDPRFIKRLDEVTKIETRSVVCFPVKGRDKVLGAIELINFADDLNLSEDDLFRLMALADFAAIAIENARYVKRIHELTITDDCTKLYNNRHLHSILDAEVYRSTRYHYEFSLIFIDLDYLKRVNDTHGHLAGSRLLLELGHSIKAHLRLIDYGFRYGGDEFVILLPQTPKRSAVNVARRLHKLLNTQTFLKEQGLNIAITASFGIASFPEDAQDKEALIRKADMAMYQVKETTRNNIAVAGLGVLPQTPQLRAPFRQALDAGGSFSLAISKIHSL
ncbi:MAG: sensor domain-containing diguanylate cyclase [Acidobacteria bacterium]|nr:sensor domain-containing diguanylate cyclase [Acidobacteriota bacterium]